MVPLISIIVPVYNTEKYLTRCVDSIIGQTYENLEIILVNDGSTDGSGIICEDFAKRDNRITVIHQDNMGRGDARKSAVKIAKGEYIGFVDADDYINIKMYEHMYCMITEYNVDMVCVGYVEEHKNGANRIVKSYNAGLYSQDGQDGDCSLIDMYLSNSNSKMSLTSNLWDKLFKSNYIKQYYLSIPNDISYAEDLACVYSCVPFLSKLYVSDVVLYHYNKCNESAITLNRSEKLLGDAIVVYNHVKSVYQKHTQKELLIKQIDEWFLLTILSLLPVAIKKRMNFYKFPNNSINGKNIVIYGAGEVGISYLRFFINNKTSNMVGIVDKNKAGEFIDDICINDIEAILKINFDYIVIAIQDKALAMEIKSDLQKLYGINEGKVLWEKPIFLVDELLN